MKTKKIYILVTILMVVTLLMTASVVLMAVQRGKNLKKINSLQSTVEQLSANLDEVRIHKENADFFNFKEKTFQLKYPEFARITNIVYRKSKEFGLNPYLVMALIQVESNFDRYAVSSAGAYGLMQINYSVWKKVYDIKREKLFDKEYNIDLGLRILTHYIRKSSGNLFLALQWYNGGFIGTNLSFKERILNSRFFPLKINSLLASRNSEEKLSM